MEDLLEHNSDLSAKLMQIGDSIVYKLVQWTKRLPFYLELPVEVSPVNYHKLRCKKTTLRFKFIGINYKKKFINVNKIYTFIK